LTTVATNVSGEVSYGVTNHKSLVKRHLLITYFVLTMVVAMLLAVTLAVLLVPSLSWASALEWITPPPPCEGPCE
jgi:uncharacterized BrkB/YihY/UPF0761 family membrane protein